MLTWLEARAKVVDGVDPMSPITRPVTEAYGLALAAPVTAPEAMPPFDNSAMDGFAVRAEDVAAATPETPVRLQVVGDRPAGGPETASVGKAEAVRIMTGAPIPPGADAVVMVEATDFWDPETHRGRLPANQNEASEVHIYRSVAAGANLRRRGESVGAGTTVLEPGHLIQGAEIGILLSVGIREIAVHPLPRVAVLSTGDELVSPGSDLGAGQIRDSNRPALLATLAGMGFPTLDLGLVGDNTIKLEERITRGAKEADFLITSGGVSVGDRDYTREVLDRLGEVDAYRVAVKPGKPQVFGHVEGTPVFGLPGNPVSSLVVFDQFVLPALKKMAGRSSLYRPTFTARLLSPIRRKPGRTEFVRVRLSSEDGGWRAQPTGPQGSGVLSSMTRANGYAILPVESSGLEPGDPVTCQFFERVN